MQLLVCGELHGVDRELTVVYSGVDRPFRLLITLREVQVNLLGSRL